MLTVTIPGEELYDEGNNEFFTTVGVSFDLEHSLVSLSKWEEKWEVPFLSSELSNDQLLDYIRCMTISTGVAPEIYETLPPVEIARINEYINAKHTATWFAEERTPAKTFGKKEVITAEIIYYWMVALVIPFECQTWHLNRLLTLIRVINEKNKPEDKNKRPKSESLMDRKRLNEQRKQQAQSRG